MLTIALDYSDDLSVEIPWNDYKGDYLTFHVISVFEGYNQENISHTLYVGRVFKTGEPNQSLDLKDILMSTGYDYEYLSPSRITWMTPEKRNFDPITARDIYISYPENIYRFVVVEFIENNSTAILGRVLNYYKDYKVGFFIQSLIYPLEVESKATVYNLLEARARGLQYDSPNRLPQIPYVHSAGRFPFSVCLYFNQAWKIKYGKAYLCGSDGSGNRVGDSIEIPLDKPMVCITVTAQALGKLQGSSIRVYGTMDSKEKGMKLANRISTCNDTGSSLYYLMWIDRTGCYQCMPFTKKAYYSENINTSTRVNYRDEKLVSSRDVEMKFVLNSDWMDEKSYKYFESIFVSPYLYIYDPFMDKTIPVNMLAKDWQAKDYKRDKKMFNLKLTLESIKPEKILS